MIQLKNSLLLIFFLFHIIVINAANDSLKNNRKYATQGIYAFGGLYYKSFYNNEQFNVENKLRINIPLFLNVYSSFKYGVRMDFSNNIAIDIAYSYSKNIHNDYSEEDNAIWNEKGDRMQSIGSNVFLPCYKKKRHGGLYITIGSSYFWYKGYYSKYRVPNKNEILEENVPMHYKLFEAKLGIGTEYKFKYFQLFSEVNFGKGIGRFNETKIGATSKEFVIGARLKIPKIFKKAKDRYHWF